MNALRQKIEAEIRERGPVPFSRYMELCLYDAEVGYYSRSAGQFGKAGDFYTSSDVHAVFGRLMARQFNEMWRVLGSPEIIVLKELGPGRGLFAQDVLDWSEKKFPEFFRALRYVLVESSLGLRQRIESALERHLTTGKAALTGEGSIAETSAASGAKVQMTAALVGTTEVVPFPVAPPSVVPLVSSPTIVFANEFFDALPVEVLSAQGSLRVGSKDGHFVETWVPPSPEEFEFLDRYSIHPEAGERVEVPLQAQAQMSAAADFDCGFLVAIDYGYTREEQLAGRHRGTLKAIRRHSVSANLYEAPGEQDITADVNFTALAAAAEHRGLHTQKLVTQSQFLLGIGEANQFADAFEDCRLRQEHAKVALQLKHLVTPAGMGESFQVLVASKGVDKEKSAAVAGLNFGRR